MNEILTSNGETVETSRKLASLQRIEGLTPIEGADKIEKATILGWHCVVKKGEFAVGDYCVFIEIDSILPRTNWSEFLVDQNRPEKPIRLKTVRLRKQVSQGLALPIGVVFADNIADIDFNDTLAIYFQDKDTITLTLGEDLTELLGITKYEVELHASLRGVARGNFPSFLHKTDETRIQSCYKALIQFITEQYRGFWAITEKCDGSSFTAYLRNGDFGICSRNLDLKETADNAFWALARKINLEEKMREAGDNFSIQGEMVGPGIQKNKLNLTEIELRVFNAFDIQNDEYFSHDAMMEIVAHLGLKSVPIIEECFSLMKDDGSFLTVDELVEMVTVKSTINPAAWAEGYVFRPRQEHVIDGMGRVSFKVINPEFLLASGE